MGERDTLVLWNAYNGNGIELTVVGVYDVATSGFGANTLYMNTETAARFMDEDSYADGNYEVSNVKFYMKNSEYADEFVATIEGDFPELDENNLVVAVDTTAYDAMVGPILSVGEFATVILVIAYGE